MPKIIYLLFILLICNIIASANTIWHIGENNNSSADLALGPSDYKKFLSKDFGYEDKFYLMGQSIASQDFPYVLPGPDDDTWGGTWGNFGLANP